jgi:alkylated DNA repair protein alkB family protein 4
MEKDDAYSQQPECPCKGIRTCAICEKYKTDKYKQTETKTKDINDHIDYEEIKDPGGQVKHYFIKLSGDELIDLYESISKNKQSIDYTKYIDNDDDAHIFSGFYTIHNLLNTDELSAIYKEVDGFNWSDSQSGRKKQDFGPKINYKKRKVKFTDSKDFPSYAKVLQDKLDCLGFLEGFKIAEIGNLLYTKGTGAHIDPHIDDYWIWGNYIIGINLLSETVMTFTYEVGSVCYELNFKIGPGDVYVMSREARYIWKHSVKKENIKDDRIVITLRQYDKNYIIADKIAIKQLNNY